MAELVSGHGATLGRYGHETISAGGKRLRPLLVCVAAAVPVVESDPLVRAAVAVELVHAATLVHDDVIDGADLRRGRPTVVATGGRLMALAHRRPVVLRARLLNWRVAAISSPFACWLTPLDRSRRGS